jgi:hypothetical protein
MNLLTLALVLTYRAFVLSGCAYLVGWHDWSPWWFVPVMLTMPFYEWRTGNDTR